MRARALAAAVLAAVLSGCSHVYVCAPIAGDVSGLRLDELERGAGEPAAPVAGPERGD